MKNIAFAVRVLLLLLLTGAGFEVVLAADFEDPNIKAMHDTVNSLPAKAESGDPQAQTGMGMINLYGFGGAQDFATAKIWFEKAAAQGYPEAMVQLGNLYENGLVGGSDPVKAMGLYRQAADLNYPQGQFRQGLLFLGGIGTDKNEPEGMRLLGLACDNGYRTACGMAMWQENNLDGARAEFNLQCQAGDRLACGYLAKLGVDETVAPAEPGQQGGRIWIYLAIGLVLVGLLIFWLIRNDSGEEEGKTE